MGGELKSTPPGASRFVGGLAGNPLLVVAATFVVAVVVTVVLMVAGSGMDLVVTVGTVATLWGLALALVIYLLTARDTDKLLDHIDALQDQLSAVLEAPGAGAEVIEAEPDEPDPTRPESITSGSEPVPIPVPIEPAPTEPAPIEPAPTEPAPTDPAPTDPIPLHPQPTQPSSPFPVPTQPSSPPPDRLAQLAERIPAPYLDALLVQTGVGIADIRRAWTPNPTGNGPWVIEDTSGARWSIMQKYAGHPTVIPLGHHEPRDRAARERKRAERQAASQAARLARLQAKSATSHHNAQGKTD